MQTTKAKLIPIEMHSPRVFSCLSEDCQHNRDCANHVSAGDYRMEWGIRPVLIKSAEKDSLQCYSFYDADPPAGEMLTFEEICDELGDNGKPVCSMEKAKNFLTEAISLCADNPKLANQQAYAVIAEYLANKAGYTMPNPKIRLIAGF